MMKCGAAEGKPETWPRWAPVDRILVLTHFSKSGNGETFLEVSNIIKGAGSLIPAREKHSLWMFLHAEHTGSLFELCHNWTMSGTALWRLLGDKNLGKNKLPKPTEMLESFPLPRPAQMGPQRGCNAVGNCLLTLPYFFQMVNVSSRLQTS